MIELHRKSPDKSSEDIEETFKDLVINYKVIEYPEEEAPSTLPFIRENETQYKTKKEIERFLDELRDELNWQRSLTGDACYLDPETGEVC